jgi:molecular chaperone DnaK
VNDPIVGIDLGTTNTVIAIGDETGAPRVLADDNGYKIHPSVVSFHPNGSVIVGAEAKQRKVIDPRNTVYSAKRLIGRSYRSREIQAAQARMPYTIKEGVNQQPVIATRGGEFAVPEISAIILDHVRNIARKRLGTEVSRAVVTVPANFNDAQRSATATAGAIAGLTIVRVLNEPTAAALAYGYQKQLSRTIAVYDFGGGTFDISVLRLDDQVYEVLGTAGDSFLGGDDLDERLVDHMVAGFLAKSRVDLRENELALMRLRQVAEQTKIELSRRSRAMVKIDEIAYGPGGAPINLEVEISRDELVSKVGDIIDRTFPVCEEALRLAGCNIGDIEDVVLVGGTTKIPHVRDRVTRFFGKTPRTDVNPEEAVAVGAALQASALQRILSNKRNTARSTIPPPGTPMGVRAATEPPVTVGTPRTTAPRIASLSTTGDAEEQTDIRDVRRSTQPMGLPITPAVRAGTERPAQRGAVVDRFEESGSRPGTNPEAKPLARITRPGAAPPPVPAAGPTARTLFGVPAAPIAAPTFPAPPTTPIVEFDELQTGSQRPDFELPATSPNFELPATSPSTAALPPEAFRPAAPQQRTMMMTPPAALPPTAGVFAPSTAPTKVGAAPPPIALAPALSPTPAGAPTMMVPAVAPPIAAAVRPVAPVIHDVTPASFGIGTVAGYCEELVRRNARLPAETKRTFVTSRDKQRTVRIRICQGESRRIDENVVLGDLVLDNLEARPRGETAIEVTFAIDASGILRVKARDARSGQEQRANLEVVGAQSAEEVAAAAGRLRDLRR